MSTFEHLTGSCKEGIRTNEEAFERHVRERNLWLFFNVATWIKQAFELGLLYWAHNETNEARRCFEICVRANGRRVEQYRALQAVPQARSEFEANGESERLARLAGYFIAHRIEKALSKPYDDEAPGRQQWFEAAFVDACVEATPIDAASYERSRKQWTQGRGPAAQLAAWDFYREVLEGGWSVRGADAMLEQHASLYAKRGKKKGMGDLITGDGQFNPLVVDFVFAAVLKRVHWQGQYRHAWPDNGVVPEPHSRPITTTKPSRFVKVSAVARNSDSSLRSRADPKPEEILAALEAHATDPRFRARPKEQEKVTASLKALGIEQDRALAEIVRRYRLSSFVSPREGVGTLSDPPVMLECARFFRERHRMSDGLVLLTEPAEPTEWEEPEGGQFVYSVRDQKVYLADVEDLSDPSRIAARAQPGVSAWTSFGTFLLWYLGVSGY